MPANYNETAVSGQRWTRCAVVTIVNPFNGVPTIRFDEEQVLSMGDGETMIRSGTGMLHIEFDPAETIQLVDPTTGADITGAVMTMAEVYTAIYSAYLKQAKARDDAS